MARTWLSIRVDLLAGRGQELWPHPGRVFAAARSHSFAHLARAVNIGFARWDHARLHLFTLTDDTSMADLAGWEAGLPGGVLDDQSALLDRLKPGEQFGYYFDLNDNWTHLCTVADEMIDPVEEIGHVPDTPTPVWGWGEIPDQHGRRFDSDHDHTSTARRLPGTLDQPPPTPPWWRPYRRPTWTWMP